MLKRRFANSIEGDFHLKYLNEKFFKGHVCCNKIWCNSPVVVNDGTKDVCIRDDGYIWFLVYPDDSNYSITIIFDDKMRLVQWYFDIAQQLGIENGVPYEDDLFLDLVITDEGQLLVLDEDELLEARQSGVIGDADVELAYSTLELLKKKYGTDVMGLKIFTKQLCRQFNLEYNF